MASRMESTGLPKMTQVTPEIYQLLKDAKVARFTVRDEVEVKGKGLMQTYLTDAAFPPLLSSSSLAEGGVPLSGADGKLEGLGRERREREEDGGQDESPGQKGKDGPAEQEEPMNARPLRKRAKTVPFPMGTGVRATVLQFRVLLGHCAEGPFQGGVLCGPIVLEGRVACNMRVGLPHVL